MIKIIDGYCFSQDRYCYTLYETGKREKKEFGSKNPTGKFVEFADVIGYYGDFTGMLNACLKHATMKAAETVSTDNIGDYLAIMKDISEKISELAKTFTV